MAITSHLGLDLCVCILCQAAVQQRPFMCMGLLQGFCVACFSPARNLELPTSAASNGPLLLVRLLFKYRILAICEANRLKFPTEPTTRSSAPKQKDSQVRACAIFESWLTQMYELYDML